MGEIVINKVGGGQIILGDRENVVFIDSAEQRKALMAENVLTINVKSAIPLNLNLGDSVSVFGEIYKINSIPEVTKTAKREYQYTIILESAVYDLLKVKYLNIDTDGNNFGGEFSLMGNVETFMNLLNLNLERVFPGSWELDEIPSTEYKNLTFSNENCLAVLQRICEEFGQEFSLLYNEGVYKISIEKVGQILPYTFEYGKGNGLYRLSRMNVDNKNIVTRLYAFGAEKNLKASYRNYSPKLKLPEVDYIEDEVAIEKFGVIEESITFNDIYPSRVGEISSLGSNVNTFIDESMDFDLNETDSGGTTKYLIPGTSAKISFLTGALAGFEFELHKYTNGTKTFEIIPFKNEKGYVFPNPDSAAYQFAEGDKYVITDIVMPDSYIEDAEERLLEKAEEYLQQNSSPRVKYELEIDPFYLKELVGEGSISNIFSEGDYIKVKDGDLNVDKSIRISAITRDILNPYNYSLELTDVVEATLIQRIIADNTEVQRIIREVGENLINPARRKQTWRTTQELLNMIFDSSGYFDTDNIRPNSIETNMLAVGISDNQLALNCVIEPNYEGDEDKVNVEEGQLIHFAIGSTPKTWDLAGSLITLTTSSAYYIYAKVEKEGDAGTIIFSTSQIKINDDGSYYHFLLGILHSPENGIRWISMTYGSTTINGRFIKTGRVQSADGETYFDLDEGKIVGRIQFGHDTNSTVIDEGIVSSGSIILGEEGTEKAGISGLGESDSSTRIWAGEEFENRNSAPFRVTQGGEVEARKRIEVFGKVGGSAVGQAGLNGDLNGTDDIRIWAGSPWSSRSSAPFRVDKDGRLTATLGRFGFFRITTSNIANSDESGNFNNEAQLVFRYDPENILLSLGTNAFPGTSGLRGLINVQNQEDNVLVSNYGININVSGSLANNYGIYMENGILHTKQTLFNGKKTFSNSYSSGGNLTLNPSLYDAIFVGAVSGTINLMFSSTTEIYAGKEILVFNTNNGSNNLVLSNIIHGHSSVTVNGGKAVRLFYSGSNWYIGSEYDNNW